MTLASMTFVPAPAHIKPLSKSLFNRLLSTPLSVIETGPHNSMFRIVPDGKKGFFSLTSYLNGSYGVHHFKELGMSKYVGLFKP